MTWGSTVKEVSISNFFQEVPAILKRFWTTYIYSFANLIGIIIMATPLIPPGYRITQMTAILPSAVQAGCHILVRSGASCSTRIRPSQGLTVLPLSSRTFSTPSSSTLGS